MSLEITIDARRAERVLADLGRFPTRSLMDAIGTDIADEVKTTLARRKKDQSTGDRWAPWSESYKRRGAPFHGSHTLLVRDGDMMRSVTHNVVGDDVVQIGPSTGKVYPRAHVEGVAGKLPKRDFLSFGPNQEKRVFRRVSQWIEDTAR